MFILDVVTMICLWIIVAFGSGGHLLGFDYNTQMVLPRLGGTRVRFLELSACSWFHLVVITFICKLRFVYCI